MKSEKEQTFLQTLEGTRYAAAYVCSLSKGKIYVLLKAFSAVLNALIPLAGLIMPGLIVNELTGEREIASLVLYVGVLLAVPFLGNAINLIVNRELCELAFSLKLQITERYYEHSLSLDYEMLENPEILLKRERASRAILDLFSMVNQLGEVLLSVVSLIAVFSIIMTLNPFVLLLIGAGIYLDSLVAGRVDREKHDLSRKLTEYDMYQGACDYMIDHISYAKEIRLFGLKDLLIGLFSNSKKESNKLEVRYQAAGWKLGLVQGATGFVQQLVLYIYLLYRVLHTGLAVGSMTIYISAVGRFSKALSAVVNAYLKLADCGRKTKELREFMEIPLKQQDTGDKEPVFDRNSVIEYRNVSFRYPGSENDVIKNINIRIRGDEKLCIVGANGAGKSTFVKLLLRLYSPTEGEILLNGININAYDCNQYRRLFAPVFQDFVKYTMSLGENIVLASKYDKEKLDAVCRENSLEQLVARLPKGYDTAVEKCFDEAGIELSGGEAQRIAIARACYHGGSIFVLDEPTAAIDPITEYDIYTRFNEIIEGKCAVIVTHRLSAVKLADKVAVFDDGVLAEYGTHGELYDKGGLYTDMYDKQAAFYQQELVKSQKLSQPS